jgi:hypothetical protein
MRTIPKSFLLVAIPLLAGVPLAAGLRTAQRVSQACRRVAERAAPASKPRPTFDTRLTNGLISLDVVAPDTSLPGYLVEEMHTIVISSADAAGAVGAARAAVATTHAEVMNAQETLAPQPSLRLSAKVPLAERDGLIARLRGIGTVEEDRAERTPKDNSLTGYRRDRERALARITSLQQQLRHAPRGTDERSDLEDDLQSAREERDAAEGSIADYDRPAEVGLHIVVVPTPAAEPSPVEPSPVPPALDMLLDEGLPFAGVVAGAAIVLAFGLGLVMLVFVFAEGRMRKAP